MAGGMILASVIDRQGSPVSDFIGSDSVSGHASRENAPNRFNCVSNLKRCEVQV